MSERIPEAEFLPGIELLPGPPAAPLAPDGRGRPRVKPVDRGQMVFRAVDVDALIEDDHPARAIWEFVVQLDLTAFYEPIAAVEGVAGRSAWDPQMLISVWVYAYSKGISSAREVARRCEFDPAFQWLTALGQINHHTLSDFRVGFQVALDELFEQTLAVLSVEGMITLERVMHDGTKIKAQCGSDSFRREERIQAHLKAAREQVEAMGDPREDLSPRQRAARQRACREREERLAEALVELENIRQAKTDAQAKEQARVSQTDPQARIMKQPDGGYAPSYNVQVSTDAAHGIIVGVGVTQSASDYGELPAAMDRVKENTGEAPQQVVVDGGFTSRENILAMDEKGVDLIGSLDEHASQSAGQMRRRGVDEAFYPAAFQYEEEQDQYRCPAGRVLRHDGQERGIGVVHHRYRAAAADCAGCAFKAGCCPQNESKGRTITRSIDAPAVRAFIEKMQTAEAKAIYRLRGGVAEFPNAWIKEKLGLRKFRLRGLVKVLTETLWASLTHNIQLWIRLSWKKEAMVMAG